MKCGLVFFKYARTHKQKMLTSEPATPALIWQIKEAHNPFYRMGRFLLLVVMTWLSWKLIFSPIDYWQGNMAARSFLHNINLPFHEFGHILFQPFGDYMQSLGGSLGQLLMPLICFVALLWKTRDAFGAAVALWWFGESFLDMVSYINDAGSLTMPLLGGNEGRSSPYGFHDWEYILTEIGLLHIHLGLAKTVHALGSILMISSLIWMLLLLHQKK